MHMHAEIGQEILDSSLNHYIAPLTMSDYAEYRDSSLDPPYTYGTAGYLSHMYITVFCIYNEVGECIVQLVISRVCL
jgi:hypothetical protein